ncbi:N-acetylmuramoyl-L-alanine amidase [Actinocorallia longicatena]|uniref:N-acetylmuramoyl-L-alanine amidase n=1 Tax=Actinocorallia longicatena TaxID=111803 RepID=A0ABP6QF19_9ACTN
MTYPYIPARLHGGAQSTITRIVIHATVSPCVKGGARNVAAYFQSKNAGGSAHYIVDPGEIVQAVKDNVVAYHAPPNTGTLGVELCDPQKGTAARWSDANHTAMLRRAAVLVRALAAAHDVPLVRLSALDLTKGKRGICGHVEVSRAFGKTDHGDPDIGGKFPWPAFMAMLTDEEDIVSQLPLLKRGATGEDVQTLRALLLARSHPEVKTVEGTFDAVVEAAVRAIQEWAGIDVDGIVGDDTWRALILRARKS